MSLIDTMTDDQISDLQRRALAVQIAEIYNAERQVLSNELSRVGVHIKAEDVRARARALLALGPVMHPYTESRPPEVMELDG